MRLLFKLFIFLVIVCVGIVAYFRYAPRVRALFYPLKLSVLEGQAPLTVQVMGPDRILELKNKTFFSQGSCGYHIDWGDDPDFKNGPNDCEKNLTHVYEKPGTYVVLAATITSAPDDTPIYTWVDRLEVIVK